MASPYRSVPFRIVAWQTAATAIVTATLFLWEWPGEANGFRQTIAALAAGLASVAPAGFYAWRASRERSAVSYLLQGVVKFVLTLMLVAGSIIVLKPAAAGFFGTLILLQGMYVMVPLLGDANTATT